MRSKFIALWVCALLTLNCAVAQMDIQTGCASYNIPIVSHSDPQSGLNHTVSLVYNSGQGIKVNQMASNVGLGWNLVAGGEVVRILHGEADDQYNPDVAVKNMTAAQSQAFQLGGPLYNNYFPNGFLYKQFSADYLPKQLAFTPRFAIDNVGFQMAPIAAEDMEQDEFALTINGTTRTFVIDKTFKVYYTDKSILKTEVIKETDEDNTLYSQNIITKIKGFIVTDNRGIVYRFDKYELDELHKLGPANSRGDYYGRTQLARGKYIISKWVLTSVTDPYTQRSLLFEYATENRLYVPDISYNAMYQKVNGVYQKKNVSLTLPMTHTLAQVLTSVVFPDNLRVNISYSSTFRGDLTGSAAISSFDIRNGIALLKRIDLENGYFFGKDILASSAVQPLATTYIDQIRSNTLTDLIEAHKYRLALLKVKMWAKDNADVQEYAFDYYTGKEFSDPAICVPSRLSSFRDYGNLYCKAHDAAVFYKLGNAAQTEEPATTDLPESKCGLLKSVKTPINGYVQFDYVRFMLYTQRQSAELVTKITASDPLSNTSYSKMYGYPDYTNTGALVPTVYGNFRTPSAALARGRDYNILYQKDEFYEFGGSISNMVVSSAASGIVGALSGAGFFPAFTMSLLGSYYINILTGFLDDLFGSETVELSVGSITNFFLTEGHPLPLLMGQVVEYDVVGSSIYKSKGYFYEWTNRYGYPEPALWSSKQLFDPGRNGNLQRVESYDQSGVTVHTKSFEYEYDGTQLDLNSRSVFYAATKFYSAPFNVVLASNFSMIGDDWILKDEYYYKTGRSIVTKETEFFNNASGQKQSADIERHNVWNKANYAVAQSYSIGSDNRVRGNNIFYVVDFWGKYPANAMLQQFKDRNYIDGVGASVSWYKTSKTATSYFVTGVTLPEYDAVSLRSISSRVYRIGAPIEVSEEDINEFDPYNLPAWLTNGNRGYDVPDKKIYRNNLLSEVWSNNNTAVSAVKYDNAMMTCANIVNAADADVSYTSFEPGSQDGWVYSLSGITYSGTAVTGKNTYALSASNSISRVGLQPAIAYRLTFWSSGDNVTVNGAAGTQLFETNGWRLYQFIVQNTTAVTISGSANLDELRLLPVIARMKTSYADDITQWQTSTCDQNNRVQYYEYDNWGRILIVRDENRNILQRYCYSQSGKPGGCPELPGGPEERCEHVYAKLFYENERTQANGIVADIVVRFFADEACTKPCQVRDLTVNTDVQKNCSGVYVDNYTPSKVANGWFVTVGYGVVKERSVSTCSTCPIGYCSNVYVLLDGDGYTPVRPLFKNSERSQAFTKAGCPSTSTAPTVTYTVPAGKYTSLYSQTQADQQAANDISANGQNYANQQACVSWPYAKLTTEPSPLGGNYLRVIVSFYSDAAATQPLTVSNLVVGYISSNLCNTATNIMRGTISGQSYVLTDNAPYSFANPQGGFPCRYSYRLETGNNYIIAN